MSFLIFNILQVLVVILLLLSAGYLFLFVIASFFFRNPRFPASKTYRKIAVLIPAYQEDAVILETLRSVLNQDYPKSSYKVVVIADSLLQSTLLQIRKLPVKLIEVHILNRTKTKALNLGMSQLSGSFEIALVLDADNVIEKGFLAKINAAFIPGTVAVQGHRRAKNTDTPLALLEAISEEINNRIFRKGYRALGFSASLAGSGMAFRYGLFWEMLSSMQAVGGFDKEIELRLRQNNQIVVYLDDAILYDEKTATPQAFKKQRRRWLAAQYHYFRTDFFRSVKLLVLTGNLNYIHKTIELVQPPRIIILLLTFTLGPAAILYNYLVHNTPVLNYLWSTLIVICCLTFLMAFPIRFYKFTTIRAILYLPLTMLLMVNSLVRIKGANKSFLHTRHTVIAADSE